MITDNDINYFKDDKLNIINGQIQPVKDQLPPPPIPASDES